MADHIISNFSVKEPTFTHLSKEDNEKFKKLYHLRERTNDERKDMFKLFDTALTLRDQNSTINNPIFAGTIAYKCCVHKKHLSDHEKA